MQPILRRQVLQSMTGALISPMVLSRAESTVTPDAVRFRPEMEPLVALIEKTPRERCAEMAVEQLKRGVSYRQFLSALFLAGVRNVNPRPPGFAMHCVFVVHAAHLMGMEAPPESRMLPLFYVLDDFKASQDRDARQANGDYTMREIKGAVPTSEGSFGEFAAAMDGWNMERAERAAVSLARFHSSAAVFEQMWQYGFRDYRNIGHKAIYVANACRTLHTIGWQHSEPVLRSLVLSLLDFAREQKVNGYALDDQCYPGNVRRMRDSAAGLSAAAQDGSTDAESAKALLNAIRDASPDEACGWAAERMKKGKLSAGAAWDGIHLAAAELRMRARGGSSLASLHCVTSMNALHYAFLSAQDARTRSMLLLQATGWVGQFRTVAAQNPANLRPFDIAALESADGKTVEDVFRELPANPDNASQALFSVAKDLPARRRFLSASLRHTVSKVNEVHYYKYLAALVEDVPLVSEQWQPHIMAAAAYYTKGPADEEPMWAKRTREALRSL